MNQPTLGLGILRDNADFVLINHHRAVAHPRVRHLPHERHRHREADAREPGLPQGWHARLPERGDNRRHPESVSDLYSTAKFAFYSQRCK